MKRNNPKNLSSILNDTDQKKKALKLSVPPLPTGKVGEAKARRATTAFMSTRSSHQNEDGLAHSMVLMSDEDHIDHSSSKFAKRKSTFIRRGEEDSLETLDLTKPFKSNMRVSYISTENKASVPRTLRNPLFN